ncbi:hypothetical protein Rhopal_006026-T1 [Rhodotorula paludigena]|uniref:U3 small nucleolar RNA-associated protein 6 N-terminal domain-containing protein n=1 Tax=Rhodotorula paludigena TaxID=86838 RepID=A0AAV5GTY8_9BASI|nr:hypothetical protein Rhopal_006026-T1 [Rhodotorula paludigena]
MGLAQGRGTKPTDYLRYIEYEGKLEKLRRARAARLQVTGNKSLSDHSITAHITQLHRLAVRRFPESLLLWDASIAHALSQQSPLLVSRTLSAAIAMHPSHTPYWIMASQWESDGDRKGMGGGNVEGARRLCMRALRFLKGNKGREGIEGPEEAVWREWIRVEVAFVERLRARWQVLGLGKDKNGGEEIVRVKGKNVEGAAEEEDADKGDEIQLPGGEDEDGEQALKAEVDQKALTGQEALLEGAIVRLVIDNLLKSYSHSIFAYNLVLSILRPLPSPLRLSLLSHVYTSLSSSISPSSPSYPAALHILATRALYDVPYVAPKQSKKRKAAEAEVAEPEDPTAIKVAGEKLVDAVGRACEEYWAVLKTRGKKGKEKEKEKVEGDEQTQLLWEQFSGWLEEMADQTDDEDLLAFLSANLASALSSAPASPFLALLQLRNLIRTGAPAKSILACAQKATKDFGTPATPPAQREQIWVARIEAVTSLAVPVSDLSALYAQATRALPYSSKLWDLFAIFTEQSASTPAAVEQWYESSIRRVLLTDALPPASFVSTFDHVDAALPPREELPRRYVHYLSTSNPAQFAAKLTSLLSTAPTLSLSFLSSVLEPSSPALPSSSSSRAFRIKLHERIVAHPDAGVDEWVAYAEELLRAGQAAKSQEVLARARAAVKLASGDGEVRRLEGAWEDVCRKLEQ